VTLALVALSRVCPLNRIPLSVAALISNTPEKQKKKIQLSISYNTIKTTARYRYYTQYNSLPIILLLYRCGILYDKIIYICGHKYYLPPRCFVYGTGRSFIGFPKGSDYSNKTHNKGEGQKNLYNICVKHTFYYIIIFLQYLIHIYIYIMYSVVYICIQLFPNPDQTN